MTLHKVDPAATPALGISGRVARLFLSAPITPLLAGVALLLGLFAVVVTPREEEPQIDVTMANVLIPFPGASPKEVEQAISTPAEQVFSRMSGLEHVVSVSRDGMAMLTLQFKVGVSRAQAVVGLHDTLMAHRDWLPAGLGVGEPILRAKGIDDVPVLSLTLHGKDDGGPVETADELEQVAHALEADLKRIPGTRDVTTIGGPGRAINVILDPQRLSAQQVSVRQVRSVLQAANLGSRLGQTVQAGHSVQIEAGPFLQDAQDVAALVVTVRDGQPVYLRDIATVRDGPPPVTQLAWTGHRRSSGLVVETPAVTLAITKQAGQNAVMVCRDLLDRIEQLRGTLIPSRVDITVSRNYGASASDKAGKLIQKLLFATASVIALVFFTLGRREAAIVGIAVTLTLTATLFASWAWGYTLNRVSLFALIFSIGILVDDAIVVVENIHRHRALRPDQPLSSLIPQAVDEVGGPTILATLTVIAALLPMAFVTGLMGPYMSPIPINASMGMLISLGVAFILTPWLSRRWLTAVPAAGQVSSAQSRLLPLFSRMFAPFLHPQKGHGNRLKLAAGIASLIVAALSLPVLQAVVLKMLPFDNKSEFQVVVDMPTGTPVEETARALQALTAYLSTVPEVTDWQAYAGTSAPINFNGLVRQYDLRHAPELGDIQVNLADKHQRKEQSHSIALRVRPALQLIAARFGATLRLAEVPPGPPVLAPIVAQIYGPSDAARLDAARAIQAVFSGTRGIVDIDSTFIAPGAKQMLDIDREKAALAGVSQSELVQTMQAGLGGENVGYLRNGAKYPTPVRLHLPSASNADMADLLQLGVHGQDGSFVPIRELVQVHTAQVAQPIWHKDLLPVQMVMADMAGSPDPRTGQIVGLDSPLYGMLGMRKAIRQLTLPGGGIQEHFTDAPADPYRGLAMKWDGEWQITYETFRDMGAAYAVGLVLIYLLVVAQFGSYRTPLVIMAPIPLTLIGVLPGHALLGAPFTATSMIGMIALAGIIVRNSILLVDFIELQLSRGVPLPQAVILSAATRAQPIALTAVAAMMGALFILDDPIFNGLAISLIFGILVSTLLTLLVIPLLYFRSAIKTTPHNEPAGPASQTVG